MNPPPSPAARSAAPSWFARMGAWVALWWGTAAVAAAPTWESVTREIARRFPDVVQLEPQALGDWLADAQREPPLLIDVRAPAEFAVSHLPGAVRAETEAEQAAVLRAVPPDRPVVFYCSVGWRSSAAAAHWQAAGRKQVFNLAGSTFRWANEGRSLERDGQSVQVVHPYNRSWGALLDRRYWPADFRD